MAKALIVSSAFPPLGTAGGTIRLVKLIKFMSDWGWKFIVFTQDPRRPIASEQILSKFLLDELPTELVIERVPAPFSHAEADPAIRTSHLGRLRSGMFTGIFGNSALPWGLLVLWRGVLAVRREKIEVIFGTSPPFTNALIASLIAMYSGTPFVLDLRDDWGGTPVFLRKNFLRQKIEYILEAFVIRRASKVITVTLESLRLYRERYAQLNQPHKFHLIPNGCDLDEYAQLATRERRIESGKFLILSVAWWYQKGHRDLSPFLLGLKAFFKKRADAIQKVEIVMLGKSLSEDYEQMLIELHLDDAIQRLGSVNREELIEWLWKADLFLLVQPVGNTTAISGTLYEYWATGKAPILLIAERGASSGLVEDNRIGSHFHFDQVDQIAEYIERNFDAYNEGTPVWINRDGVENFDRRYLAERMSGIWLNLISEE